MYRQTLHFVNRLQVGGIDDAHGLARGGYLPLAVKIVFVHVTVNDLFENSSTSHIAATGKTIHNVNKHSRPPSRQGKVSEQISYHVDGQEPLQMMKIMVKRDTICGKCVYLMHKYVTTWDGEPKLGATSRRKCTKSTQKTQVRDTYIIVCSPHTIQR